MNVTVSIEHGDCLYQSLFHFDAFKWEFPFAKSLAKVAIL